jgi:ankyrin repeat protein
METRRGHAESKGGLSVEKRDKKCTAIARTLMSILLGVLVSPHIALVQIAPSASELAVYGGLHAAAAKGDPTEIEQLVKIGSPIDLRDSRSRTPLHVAVYMRKPDTAFALLRLGADPNAFEAQQYDIVTIAAAHLGHDDVVRTLIAAKAPLDHVNNLGWTALIESIVLGDGGKRHIATLNALVDAGANVNLADRLGKTPLALAKKRGFSEMAKILETLVRASRVCFA